MSYLPRDISDLHLAPVALLLDARITELALLDNDELAERVAFESDCPDWTLDLRIAGLLGCVRHCIDCHNWALSWEPRGIGLSHGEYAVVLGVPPTFVDYVQSVSVADVAGGVRAVDADLDAVSALVGKRHMGMAARGDAQARSGVR